MESCMYMLPVCMDNGIPLAESRFTCGDKRRLLSDHFEGHTTFGNGNWGLTAMLT